ncbi:MAG: MFS transporter [Acidobacteria bacterium]|nr:MAG: MFS transporter [Acidobacteriota bacterium]
MIYPLLPVFLSTTLGAGPIALGMVEGVAETTAALVKIISGWWTDRTRRRKPFVLAGYALAGLVRPLIGLASSWLFVLTMRFLDRVGKGLRTSPRDALITDVTPSEIRARAFGLHRSLDHAGAVAGPVVAAVLMSAAGFPMRTVFFLAAVPAAVVMLVIVYGIRENTATEADRDEAHASTAGRPGERALRPLLLVLLLFTLGNSTDAFLLLRLSSGGVSAAWIALLWSAHHVVKMICTYFGGRLADRVGDRPMIQAGWLLYGGVYLGFAYAVTSGQLIALFLVYGVYYGLTEPAERAWISRLASTGRRGRAFGYYHAVIGLAALPASLMFGALWQAWGVGAAFSMGAVLALVAAVVVSFVPVRRPVYSS